MKESLTYLLVFVLAINVAKTDVRIHDAISGKGRHAENVGFGELFAGTIKSEKSVRACNSNDVTDFNAYKNCMSRYFDTEVTKMDHGSKYTCAKVELTATSFDYIPEICYNLKGAFWYGGAELQYQRWPIRGTSLPMQPYVTNDIVPLNQSFGNVIERYWINSKGIGIRVDENVPLSVSFNNSNNQICFRANNARNYISANEVGKHASLVYEMCKATNVKEMFMLFSSRPAGKPDSRMIKSPIWSTWAKYKVHIDQSKVLQYANEIVVNGFSNSQIEIDDMFSTHYGEFDFTPKKFENPKDMIKKLKENGFRVTVWITPFANLDSPAFLEGMEKGYWLKDFKGQVPALVKWWQGVGGILDVENDEAINWYIGRLVRMKEEYGVDSFKFDAGEVTYLPPFHEYSDTWSDQTLYTTKYVAAVSKLGPMIEVRCGYQSQKYPVFVRMGDKESRWGFDNGLQSVIPTVLTMGILGYPYILPDMIGGNGYVYDDTVENPFINTELPDRELYIRWLELTAYMPAMQFSFVPWQYDKEVIEIARKYVKIHEDTVTPIIIEASEKSQKTGDPLIRPLWWIAPDDTDALECETQFLVGDYLLVAPVVEKGARQRDIYLPQGVWEDARKGDTLKGGKWLFKYIAELDEVPTFTLKH
ncbi:myogenesis-regulating glycosidase-like [Mercenaria mercenaria]|uniref:myogenesis-regulating glycosidase-like n=1 Tax=Mercenaria mercenaria TaxID=6596 RepID=UPI00234E6293|nr:myogenesis-regulating glycosidase-like [Mercenaria mercenaria]XP_045209933.2 myogenesis-regulating glycosidase-like [Mercenaria mercenaria]XP_053409079.1 myogenesis-regulating glycosidase-like [Mercenaria mercenaria]